MQLRDDRATSLRRLAEQVQAAPSAQGAAALARAVLQALDDEASPGSPYRQGAPRQGETERGEADLVAAVVALERQLEACQQRLASLERSAAKR